MNGSERECGTSACMTAPVYKIGATAPMPYAIPSATVPRSSTKQTGRISFRRAYSRESPRLRELFIYSRPFSSRIFSARIATKGIIIAAKTQCRTQKAAVKSKTVDQKRISNQPEQDRRDSGKSGDRHIYKDGKSFSGAVKYKINGSADTKDTADQCRKCAKVKWNPSVQDRYRLQFQVEHRQACPEGRTG